MPEEREPESLFADCLQQVEEDPQVDFESWLRDHPDHEEELRQLHEGWMVGRSPRP